MEYQVSSRGTGPREGSPGEARPARRTRRSHERGDTSTQVLSWLFALVVFGGIFAIAYQCHGPKRFEDPDWLREQFDKGCAAVEKECGRTFWKGRPKFVLWTKKDLKRAFPDMSFLMLC